MIPQGGDGDRGTVRKEHARKAHKRVLRGNTAKGGRLCRWAGASTCEEALRVILGACYRSYFFYIPQGGVDDIAWVDTHL